MDKLYFLTKTTKRHTIAKQHNKGSYKYKIWDDHLSGKFEIKNLARTHIQQYVYTNVLFIN